MMDVDGATVYKMLQMVSVESAMAAVCILLDNLAEQMTEDVDGMDEEREEIRAIYTRCDRIYENLHKKIRETIE